MEKMVIQSPQAAVKKWLKLGLSYGLTLVFVYVLIKNINIHELTQSILSVPVPLLCMALLALSIGYMIRAIRWGFMLRAINKNVQLHHCIGPFVTSMAVNNILPLRAGDLMRMFGFHTVHQLKPAQVLGTLVLERLLDLLMILTLFFISLQWVAIGAIPTQFIQGAQLLTCVAAIILLGTLALPHYVRKLLNRISHMHFVQTHPWCNKILNPFYSFLDAIELIRSAPRMALLIILSAVAWIFEGGIYLVAAHAFHYQGHFIGPYFASTLGALSTLLPSSPGYVGTFDYFTMLGLRAFDIAPQTATSIAVFVHLILWLPVILAGFLFYICNRPRQALIGNS